MAEKIDIRNQRSGNNLYGICDYLNNMAVRSLPKILIFCGILCIFFVLIPVYAAPIANINTLRIQQQQVKELLVVRAYLLVLTSTLKCEKMVHL
jgi:hypothetical protein